LIRVQEDFSSSREKSDQLSLELIDSNTIVEGLNSRIGDILRVVRGARSLDEVKQGVDGVDEGHAPSISRSNTDDVVQELEMERTKTRDLEARLESMKNSRDDEKNGDHLFNASASDTETEDEGERPKKSRASASRVVKKVADNDGVMKRELEVALRRVEENEQELQAADARLNETSFELLDARTQLEKATSQLGRTIKDTQALRMDLRDAKSRVDVLTKKVDETGLVYTRLSLLHHTLACDANPDVFDVGVFITCVENMVSDKQDLFKKVQASAGVSDELEKQRVAVVRLTADLEKSGSEHRAELIKREGGLKDQLAKMEKAAAEYKKEVGVLAKKIKTDTATFKATNESSEAASHRMMVERDAYSAQKTELSESVEKTTDALSRSQKARDSHVKGMLLVLISKKSHI
jgi:chromosome segregation ATPase